MKKLTEQFTTASVKKDEIFELDLLEGSGVTWEVRVAAGSARSFATGNLPPNEKNESIKRVLFIAEEAGEVEIVAKSRKKTCTFKVQVN